MRTDPTDFRKTTSNHEIDLCQIYGLDAGDTAILRSHIGGLLRSEMIDGSEYPARLFGNDGLVKPELLGLKYVDKGTRDLNPAIFTAQHFANMPERKSDLFVSGLERGNSTIFYSAISTIFLREHNRLCREMAKRHPDWDDDRLFETARNANIVELLQIIIGDYINHLSTALFHVYVDPASPTRSGGIGRIESPPNSTCCIVGIRSRRPTSRSAISSRIKSSATITRCFLNTA